MTHLTRATLATLAALALLLSWGCRKQAAEPPAPAFAGTLVLGGGEFVHPDVRARFVALAGGAQKRFLYIPTASSGIRLPGGVEYVPTDADTTHPKTAQFERELARYFRVSRVIVMHTRVRATADNDAFANQIRQADAVWLSSGNAGRLAEAYLDTKVHAELKALLARGGVIGGNSAGAIIQGSFILRGRPDKPVLVAPGRTRGFGFLPGVAINAHLLSARRENELVTVLDAHPTLVGIGIPDSAGAIVRNGVLEPLGDGRLAIYDNERHGSAWYYFLARNQRFDLRTRSVVQP